MIRRDFHPRPSSLGVLKFLVPLACAAAALAQQDASDYAAKKKQAGQEFDQSHLSEALKDYEELASNPAADTVVFSRLGYLLYSAAENTSDDRQRKELADRARKTLERAKQLGDNTVLTNAMLNTLARGTPAYSRFSANSEADSAMKQGELLYFAGDLEQAIEYYKKAVGADPQLYAAAVDIGDCYYKIPGKLEQAPEWFAKAISINPYNATAYRYWADDLMKMGKREEARGKYIEAYTTNPFDRPAVASFFNWAKGQNLAPAHPAVTVPISIEGGTQGFTVTVQPGVMDNVEPVKFAYSPISSPPGYGASLDVNLLTKYPNLAAWLRYATARMLWAKQYFEAHPGEHSVRHNLQQETLAFRAAISGLDPHGKDLDRALATLMELDRDGLLEAYILLARSDTEIAEDYHVYLADHRDLLRRYVAEWMLSAPRATPGSAVSYRPALGDRPSKNDMDSVVTKADLGDHFQLSIKFTAPQASTRVPAPFTLIKVYGYQRTGPPGTRATPLPVTTFPYFDGSWSPGDQVQITVDVPKQYSDPGEGWGLTFCVGSANGACIPSPNLLTGKPVR